MRTLSGTLAAAVIANGRQPIQQLFLADDKEHYALYRQDTPAKATDGCAACLAGDGSLIRAALFDNGGAANADLAVQRITDPNVAAQWTTWSTLVAAGCQTARPIALSNNPGNVLRLFYGTGASLGATVNVFESTNDGASWTGPTTVVAGVNSLFYLGSAGNDDLFACRNLSLGIWDVQFFKKSAGVWAAPVTWPFPTYQSMVGIAPFWTGSEYLFALSGWKTNGTGIEAYSFDGAAAWTDLNFAVPIDGGALGFQFRFPSIAFADGFYRLSFVENDDGSLGGVVYDRWRVAKSADFIHWSSPAVLSPQTFTTPYPCPFVKVFGHYFATSPTYTFAWPIYSPGDPTLNTTATDQVEAYERHERLAHPAQYKFTLSNQDGQYNAMPGLVKNATITLDEGYVGGAGAELVQTVSGLVEHWYFSRAPGENDLVIIAQDQSRWLDYPSPILLNYTGQQIVWLAVELAARAGIFNVFWPGTPALAQTIPTFAVQPGQTYRHALQRLLDTYALEYVVRADGSLVMHDPSEAIASSWVWQNEIESAQLGVTDLQANHVRVYANQFQAEAWDYAAEEATGAERYLQVVDRTLASDAQTAIRASNELLLEQRKARGGEIHVPNNPGLELLDEITVVDAAIALNQTYRCQAISVSFDVLRAQADMAIQLSGV